MIQIISSRIVDCLIRHNAINTKDKELYKYAVNVTFLTISPIILALTWGLLFRGLYESVTIIFPFMVIRKYSGGYHTKHALTCMISSSLILIFCIYIAIHVNCNYIIFILNGGACISLAIFSPVEHENKKLSERERKKYSMQTRKIVFSIYLICIITYWLDISKISLCLSIGCIMSAVMQIPPILNNLIYIYHLKL